VWCRESVLVFSLPFPSQPSIVIPLAMAPPYSTTLLLILLSSVLRALAQALDDPLKNFCQRYGHQTAVIDRKMYIDGGWLYANQIARNPEPVISNAVSIQPLQQQLLMNLQTKDCCIVIWTRSARECRNSMPTSPRTTQFQTSLEESCGKMRSTKCSGCTEVNSQQQRRHSSSGVTM
jgi:hypothetical protein